VARCRTGGGPWRRNAFRQVARAIADKSFAIGFPSWRKIGIAGSLLCILHCPKRVPSPTKQQLRPIAQECGHRLRGGPDVFGYAQMHGRDDSGGFMYRQKLQWVAWEAILSGCDALSGLNDTLAWKPDDDHRTNTNFAFYADRAAMKLDELLYQRQAKPSPLVLA
jgi:hypothetical protein